MASGGPTVLVSTKRISRAVLPTQCHFLKYVLFFSLSHDTYFLSAQAAALVQICTDPLMTNIYVIYRCQKAGAICFSEGSEGACETSMQA